MPMAVHSTVRSLEVETSAKSWGTHHQVCLACDALASFAGMQSMWKGEVKNEARSVGGGQPDIEQQPEDFGPHLGRASEKHVI